VINIYSITKKSKQMSLRNFKDSYSPALRQQLAQMTDAEYQAWEKEIGCSTDQKGESNTQAITDMEIKEWAKQTKTQ
jgi:hypothetical protein